MSFRMSCAPPVDNPLALLRTRIRTDRNRRQAHPRALPSERARVASVPYVGVKE